jgi:hypothetical protein
MRKELPNACELGSRDSLDVIVQYRLHLKAKCFSLLKVMFIHFIKYKA